ncbi:glycosyltransferase family 2 protein [Budvicia aquatica]|uniref:glycosyltransferase family 2 protein n=1 Tax=Budvicia aquatica TaxID=82979 RepID=UPI002089AB63|nr:glycosyltransferase family A protein [Budvicia aquatica]GKX51174.1 glycosyl transferase [Budvicia aquatica]
MKTSVIITTKNRESCFYEALHSVLEQSYLPNEIIVIDDGSDVEKNLTSDSAIQIKYLYNVESIGVAAARNMGIEKAIGDVIFFLDDDDIWLKDHVKNHVHEHLNNRILLCFSQKNIFFNDSGNILRTTSAQDINVVDIFDVNFIGSPSGVSLKKNIFKNINKFDVILKALEDYELWLRIIQYFGVTSVSCLDKVTINYRVSQTNSGNISHNIENHIAAKQHILYVHRDNKEKLSRLRRYLNFCVLKTIHRISYFKMLEYYFHNLFFSRKMIRLIVPYKLLNIFGVYST